MWLALPVLLISASLGPTFSEMCLRHVSYHYICHDDYDLTHLNLLFNITETLLQEGTITSSRADVMKRTLQFLFPHFMRPWLFSGQAQEASYFRYHWSGQRPYSPADLQVPHLSVRELG